MKEKCGLVARTPEFPQTKCSLIVTFFWLISKKISQIILNLGIFLKISKFGDPFNLHFLEFEQNVNLDSQLI